jgi:hypothetical protein
VVTTGGPRRWPRRLAQVVLGLAAAALAVGGVVAVGNISRTSLGPQDRYQLRFADIECPTPPGQDRNEFIEEVRYLGKLPDPVNVLDPALPERLREAFAAHRRVAKVGKVIVLPPKRVQVELTFRP